jgi:hypothetical protein
VHAYSLYREDLVQDEDYHKTKRGTLALNYSGSQYDHYGAAVEYFI